MNIANILERYDESILNQISMDIPLKPQEFSDFDDMFTDIQLRNEST